MSAELVPVPIALSVAAEGRGVEASMLPVRAGVYPSTVDSPNPSHQQCKPPSRPAPAFQFALHHQNLVAGLELLDVEELQWMPLGRISISLSRVMLPHPLIQIIRVPDVQGAIGAFEDVEAERDDSVPFDSAASRLRWANGMECWNSDARRGVQSTPRFIWSRSMDSNSAWKLPSPKPSLPLRWMISKKIGPITFWVKICSSRRFLVSWSASIRILLRASRGTSSPWLGTRL